MIPFQNEKEGIQSKINSLKKWCCESLVAFIIITVINDVVSCANNRKFR